MKVLTETFEIKHQTEFTDWENENTQSRNLFTLLNKMKMDFIALFDIESVVVLPYKLFEIIDSNPSFRWSAQQNPNPAHLIDSNNGYWYGGTLSEIEIYYDHNLDKIYCSDSINEIHRYIKREERRKKLEQIGY